MPRQSRGRAAPARSAPSRPVAAPQRSNVTPPGPPARSATTVAHPPAVAGQKAGVPAQQGSSPGLFGQMASTAAAFADRISRTKWSGVAVGSSIGHAIGGFFGGGSSDAPTAETQQTSVASQGNETAYENSSWGASSCEVDAKQFTKCLDENGGNMQICGWYLEQLKACQQAASQY